jgi:hypothetical protein
MHLTLTLPCEDVLVDAPQHPMTAYSETLGDALSQANGKCSPEAMGDFFNDLAQTASCNGIGGDDEGDGFPVTSITLPEGFSASDLEIAKIEFEAFGIELR